LKSRLKERAESGDPHAKLKIAWEACRESIVFKTVVLVRDYVIIIFIGALFFRFFSREQGQQEIYTGQKMTLIDCLFFATVVSNMVGYGHIIVPQTDGAKLFCIFYFLISTSIAAQFVRNFAGLWQERKKKEIHSTIIGSTVWVHKADLHGTGFIYQADYGEISSVFSKKKN